MSDQKRMCPRSARGAEHEMRRDERGWWYCPIERDAEMAERYAGGTK